MSEQIVISNQETILANQEKILANQGSIESNQAKLDKIVANQESIRRQSRGASSPIRKSSIRRSPTRRPSSPTSSTITANQDKIFADLKEILANQKARSSPSNQEKILVQGPPAAGGPGRRVACSRYSNVSMKNRGSIRSRAYPLSMPK